MRIQMAPKNDGASPMARSSKAPSRSSSGNMKSLAAETTGDERLNQPVPVVGDSKDAQDFLDAFDQEDPIEKIKRWKPPMQYESLVPEHDKSRGSKIIGKPWQDPWKGKPIPSGVYWRKLKKEREAEPPTNEEPYRDFMHFERTADDTRLVEFLTDCLTHHSLQLQDFRQFPYCTDGVKNREIFDPEVGKMPMRKKQRMCWKLAAHTGLRGPQDVLQLTNNDWVRGHMPLPFAFIKKEMLNHYYTELSDLDRAALWMSVGETQRHVDHQRMLDFPLKVTPLPTEEDGASIPRPPISELKRYQNVPPSAYHGLYNHVLRREVEGWQVKAARAKFNEEMQDSSV